MARTSSSCRSWLGWMEPWRPSTSAEAVSGRGWPPVTHRGGRGQAGRGRSVGPAEPRRYDGRGPWQGRSCGCRAGRGVGDGGGTTLPAGCPRVPLGARIRRFARSVSHLRVWRSRDEVKPRGKLGEWAMGSGKRQMGRWVWAGLWAALRLESNKKQRIT